MLKTLKAILHRLPLIGRPSDVMQISQKTSHALRQLVRRYQRQKRLWIYIILSSVSLMVVYILFSLLWIELWQGGGIVPVAWIILAGVGIAIYQVRRCNDVIQTLREAYVVQVQIEKAEAEAEAEQEKEEKQQVKDRSRLKEHPSRNGAQSVDDDE